MNTRARRRVIVAALAGVIAGVTLSHVIEPGVMVQAMTLPGGTPALRLSSTAPGAHPTALLAHGVTGSKETLFRYGEALAAAGFDCTLIDLPGHGDSRRVFAGRDVGFKPAEVARALGSVDVFVGHSMGAGAGARSVREAGFAPRLFIAVGADPMLGEHGPPLLLLAGQFEEFVSPARLKARTDARLVLSPWSDHALELLDPCLVKEAVEAACVTVGKTPPAAPTAWLWRLAGLVLGMAGALVLSFCLPELPPRLAAARGVLVAAVVITTLGLTMGTWFGCVPYWHRLPLQLVLMVVVWLAVSGVGKLGFPRWSLAALGAGSALVCVLGAASAKPGEVAHTFLLLSLITVITAILLADGALLGWLAGRGGSRRDGDIAMVVFVGYAVGQWIPKFF
ncbi:MAG TPA: hypothetical protein VN578_00040 [Candidatus Binatia bacterium]|jgi:hypothetical protein|nr:hypothetical protein [Candidatus Binatia bacterium]